MEDPVFSRWKRGAKLLFWPNFTEKLHQIKIIGRRACLATPGSANGTTRNSFEENV